MKINSLSLKNFRNYESLDLMTNDLKFVFLGENAQGKTNLIEAMYFASTLRSFRTNEDFQLVKFNEDFCKIKMEIQRLNEKNKLEIIISKNGKYILLDGIPIKKYSDIMGKLNAVLFTPNDMKQFYSSPKDRRRFIDIELGKISPKYLNELLVFQKLLKERNAYLKQRKIDKNYFDVLTERLVDSEVEIMKARNVFIQLLESHANKLYRNISNEDYDFKIAYKSCIPISDDETMKRELLSKYSNIYEREIENGITLLGINREDIDLYLDDKSVIDYGSQGQKRSCILAIKIALLEIIKLKINEYPIILLDDVLSELDERHCRNLFSCIPDGVQMFVTTTDIHINDLLSNTTCYKVSRGFIKKEE